MVCNHCYDPEINIHKTPDATIFYCPRCGWEGKEVKKNDIKNKVRVRKPKDFKP